MDGHYSKRHYKVDIELKKTLRFAQGDSHCVYRSWRYNESLLAVILSHSFVILSEAKNPGRLAPW
jgi:hypothetical protein